MNIAESNTATVALFTIVYRWLTDSIEKRTLSMQNELKNSGIFFDDDKKDNMPQVEPAGLPVFFLKFCKEHNLGPVGQAAFQIIEHVQMSQFVKFVDAFSQYLITQDLIEQIQMEMTIYLHREYGYKQKSSWSAWEAGLRALQCIGSNEKYEHNLIGFMSENVPSFEYITKSLLYRVYSIWFIGCGPLTQFNVCNNRVRGLQYFVKNPIEDRFTLHGVKPPMSAPFVRWSDVDHRTVQYVAKTSRYKPVSSTQNAKNQSPELTENDFQTATDVPNTKGPHALYLQLDPESLRIAHEWENSHPTPLTANNQELTDFRQLHPQGPMILQRFGTRKIEKEIFETNHTPKSIAAFMKKLKKEYNLTDTEVALLDLVLYEKLCARKQNKRGSDRKFQRVFINYCLSQKKFTATALMFAMPMCQKQFCKFLLSVRKGDRKLDERYDDQIKLPKGNSPTKVYLLLAGFPTEYNLKPVNVPTDYDFDKRNMVSAVKKQIMLRWFGFHQDRVVNYVQPRYQWFVNAELQINTGRIQWTSDLYHQDVLNFRVTMLLNIYSRYNGVDAWTIRKLCEDVNSRLLNIHIRSWLIQQQPQKEAKLPQKPPHYGTQPRY